MSTDTAWPPPGIKWYYHDQHTALAHGDSLELLPKLPKIHVIISDPPYGTQGLAGGYGRRQIWGGEKGGGRVIQNDNDLEIVQKAWPLMRGLVDEGWILLFYGSRKTPEFINATNGKEWFGEMIWNKTTPGLGHHIRYQHESIGVFRIGEPERPKKPIMSVIDCYPNAGLHPHEKPLKVLIPMVEWACFHYDLVVDPFCGISSTLLAAKQAGKKAIGFELEESFCEIGATRLSQGTLL